MKLLKKAIENYKGICKDQSDKRTSNKEVLEAVWEQVFPEDAELRIQRAFEMLSNDCLNPPS